MGIFIVKTVVAALAIASCSWLSSKRPDLAGFFISLPLTTIIVLIFSYAEFSNSEKSVQFAKSIFVGVPTSMLFFVPFLLAEKFQLGFLTCFVSGIAFLICGFFIHRFFFSML